MASNDLSGRPLQQVALTTADLPAAVAFYRDALGLPLLFEVSGMAFFQLGGGVRLMIGAQEGAEEGFEMRPGVGGTCLYIDAPDLPTLGPALEARGVVFLGPAETVQRTEAGDLQLRFFRDPDQNLLALMGLVARAA